MSDKDASADELTTNLFRLTIAGVIVYAVVVAIFIL